MENKKTRLINPGLKLRVTIGAWCVTLEVSLLRKNILAASRTLQKNMPAFVSPITIANYQLTITHSPFTKYKFLPTFQRQPRESRVATPVLEFTPLALAQSSLI